MEERYRALRIIATLLFVLGWITLVVGALATVIGFIATLSSEDGGRALLILFIGVLYTAFIALYFFAAAALIRLLINVEENTRRTAAMLERMAPAGGPGQPSATGTYGGGGDYGGYGPRT